MLAFSVCAAPSMVDVNMSVSETDTMQKADNTAQLHSTHNAFLYTYDSVSEDGTTATNSGVFFDAMNTTGNVHLTCDVYDGYADYFWRISPMVGATGNQFPTLIYPINKEGIMPVAGDEVFVSYDVRIGDISTGLAADKIASTNFQLRTFLDGGDTINHSNPGYTWKKESASFILNSNGTRIKIYYRINPQAGYNYSVDVDNVKIIINPHKVTFSAPDAIDAPSVYSAYDGERMILPSAYKPGYSFAGWYDGNKTYFAGRSYEVTSDITLTATFNPLKTSGEPGINLLTGTENAFDFDTFVVGSLTESAFSGIFSSVGTFDSKSIKNDFDRGNYLSLTASKGAWPAFGIGELRGTSATADSLGTTALGVKYNTLKENRPVLVSYNFMKKYSGAETVKQHLFIMKNNTNWVHSKPNGFGDLNTWKTGSVVFESNKIDGTDAQKNFPLSAIYLEMSAQTETTEFCFDDLSFMPFYKVTYLSENGETVKSEYVLTDANGALLKEYTVDNSITTTSAAKRFVGWTTVKGEKAVSKVTLNNEDIVLYPVFESLAPTSIDSYSLRMKDDKYGTGVRFAAYVDNQRRNSAVEYGFIVTLKSLLGDYDDSELAFVNGDTSTDSGKTAGGVTYVRGKAYSDAEEIDKIFATDGSIFGADSLGEGYYFTAVVYNLPKNKASYREVLVVKPYLKTADGIAYGNALNGSAYEIALLLRNTNYEGLSEEQIALVDEIIEISEA